MAHYNTLYTNFTPINTSMLLFACTLSTCCEKCQVTNTSRQKMSLEAAKFPPHPNTCYSINMVKHFIQGEWHRALNIYSARKDM
jgi:hypothetical protein